jgi:hypothetical protein
MIYNFIGVFIFATLIFLLLYYDFKRLLWVYFIYLFIF